VNVSVRNTKGVDMGCLISRFIIPELVALLVSGSVVGWPSSAEAKTKRVRA
jgi:hypothetical protein